MSESTVYAVERWNWATDGNGRFHRLPGTERVRTFDKFDEAEAYRARHEAKARKKVNPFRCGNGFRYWTSLDLPRLHDWMLDVGITPPTLMKGKKQGGPIDWADWWVKESGKWDDHKRAKAWEALDKVRFFEVVPVPRRPTVFVVSEVNWNYNDEYYYSDPDEGTRAVKAFRTRERAEAHRQELEAEARAAWAGQRVEDSASARPRDDPLADKPRQRRDRMNFVDATEATFYTVIEVEMWDAAGE